MFQAVCILYCKLKFLSLNWVKIRALVMHMLYVLYIYAWLWTACMQVCRVHNFVWNCKSICHFRSCYIWCVDNCLPTVICQIRRHVIDGDSSLKATGCYLVTYAILLFFLPCIWFLDCGHLLVKNLVNSCMLACIFFSGVFMWCDFRELTSCLSIYDLIFDKNSIIVLGFLRAKAATAFSAS